MAGQYSDVGAGRGDFKTPTLRDVTRTAPYMHDGSLATLDDFVDFYDRGGRPGPPNPSIDSAIHPLNLTADEKHALVSSLGTLAGTISSDLRAQRP